MEVPQWLERTELLIGDESIIRLLDSNVLLVGLGGVGSYAGEFLVRAGIGKITIIDGDVVDPTNINRQLQAVHSTINMSKAQLLKDRFKDINPALNIKIFEKFMEPQDMIQLIEDEKYDFVLDCIDSITPKHIGADMNYAWPTAEIAVMGAKGASEIIFKGEIAKSDDPAAKLLEKEKEYQEKFANPYRAAARGFIDEVIEPRETRRKLIRAFSSLEKKKVLMPNRKHGNIPM